MSGCQFDGCMHGTSYHWLRYFTFYSRMQVSVVAFAKPHLGANCGCQKGKGSRVPSPRLQATSDLGL